MLKVCSIMDKTFPCTVTCDTLIHMGKTTDASALIYDLLLLLQEISKCLAPDDRPKILKSSTFLALEGMHVFLKAGDQLIWSTDFRDCTFYYDKERSCCLFSCFRRPPPSELIYGWLSQMRVDLVEWSFQNGLTIFKRFKEATKS